MLTTILRSQIGGGITNLFITVVPKFRRSERTTSVGRKKRRAPVNITDALPSNGCFDGPRLGRALDTQLIAKCCVCNILALSVYSMPRYSNPHCSRLAIVRQVRLANHLVSFKLVLGIFEVGKDLVFTRATLLARVLPIAMCLSVCLSLFVSVSVCLSQVGDLSKGMNGLIRVLAWRLLATSPTLCF